MTEEKRERTFGDEVVLEYRQPLKEAKLEYTRLLPERMRPRREPGRRRRGKRGLWIFLACLLLVAGLSAAAWFLPDVALVGGPALPQRPAEPPAEQKTEITMPLWEPEADMRLTLAAEHGPALTPQEIYRRVNPAVVAVEVWAGKGGGMGTGVIFTADGYILTNHHVVAGGKRCSVLLADNRLFEGMYVAGDANNDLAVLKISGTDLPAAELGRSSELSVGDPVYAIGNPLSVELRGTFTDGIVSAVDRDVQVDGRSMTLVQTNAALNSGNSGGPLINCYGQVVGINTIKMNSNFSTVEGLGFAIPTSTLEQIVNELLEYGHVLPEPQLGISVSQIGEVLEDGLSGLLVQQVVEDSAADRAGIQVGDYVITADGEPLTSSGDLLRVRSRFEIGDRLDLTIWREGELMDVTLDLLEAVPEA